jgi:alpha-L-fucosidase
LNIAVKHITHRSVALRPRAVWVGAMRAIFPIRLIPFLAVLLAGASGQTLPSGAADTGDANAQRALIKLEPPEKIAQRLAWWEDARFGMFIHWGLYSQWGCHYPDKDGNLLNGKTEHMMRHLQIPLANYAKIADVFNPTCFNADEWAQIAQDAGMKYMVITSKHHDGFAMFGSTSSDYNIAQRTPFHRDPIRELAEAGARHGLKFAVYYSLGRDWQDPDVPTRDGYRSNTWDYPDEAKKNFTAYFERKVKPQVRELLTNYGPIAIMWFDTPEKISKAQSEELFNLIHQLQPNCIVNQRVGNRLGDYRVEEQNIPGAGHTDPWETCMTLNKHWGYYFGDEDWKPTQTLVRNLIEVASKGGNFLLNVGPTGEGVIPPPSVARLREVGAWLKVNGAAIYGTTASSIAAPAWGRLTQRVGTDGHTALYLHVYDWPANGKLVLAGARSPVASATLLATGAKLNVTARDGTTVIAVPTTAPDKIASVIAVQLVPISR